jgi:predicted lipid carrier protein YhbT
VRYLSPEWLAAAADAVAHDTTLRRLAAEVDLTYEMTVADGPEGTVCWHVTIRPDDVRLTPGPADRADLRFTTSWDVACAIARGEQAAATAFIDGHLRVGGDLSLLLHHQRRLSAVDDTLADLRPHTTWE